MPVKATATNHPTTGKKPTPPEDLLFKSEVVSYAHKVVANAISALGKTLDQEKYGIESALEVTLGFASTSIIECVDSAAKLLEQEFRRHIRS